jgi:hypothetical protein
LVEIIRCGVPGGTAMPHFRFAHEARLLGMTGAEVGDKRRRPPPLAARRDRGIVAYLEAR